MAQTPAGKRSAQRKLAREIKTGTYKPSSIGAKARAAASKLAIIEKIRQYKNLKFGGRPQFDQKQSDKNAKVNADTGIEWTLDELRKISKVVDIAIEEDYDYEQWEESDYEAVLYYH